MIGVVDGNYEIRSYAGVKVKLPIRLKHKYGPPLMILQYNLVIMITTFLFEYIAPLGLKSLKEKKSIYLSMSFA